MAPPALPDLLMWEHSAIDFAPYCAWNAELQSVDIYIRPDAYYSKQLTDHVTLFQSLEEHEVVGCQIKEILQLLRSMPDFNDHGREPSIVFEFLREATRNENIRATFEYLASATAGLTLPLIPRTDAEETW